MMTFRSFSLYALFCFAVMNLNAQLLQNKQEFTRQDTLRGSITPERAWWDLTYYHLDISVDPSEKYISGKNTIHFKTLKPQRTLQIDLQPPLKITKVLSSGKELSFTSEVNAHFITLEKTPEVGSLQSIEVHYEGHPKEAVRAPWDGGFSWKKDNNGHHFVATSCQGLGASVWWPNKDHMYDEVDSMLITVTQPKGLSNISNGQLRQVIKNEDEGTVTSNWFVANPINNYGVNVNIGDYVHFSETYEGEKGPLAMDYYVLSYNLEKAKEHFKDAPKMMEAFEHWFGPYPFYEDGFKLVEVPYLGMEHQSSVTYGNQYKKGYLGNDLSSTGWGLKFDFIIIHEAGHEWFANNITYKDVADMWIHESFTAYSENLFLDYYFGKEAASDYVIGTRRNIQNDRPIIGPYNVNKEGSGDMYYKGANMLHTIRSIINDDEKWRMILRGLNKRFYHQTVTSKEIEDYISTESGIDLSPVFDQYLRTADIPTLEYRLKEESLMFRWTGCVQDFNMPIDLLLDGKKVRLTPSTDYQSLVTTAKRIEIDRNFYVEQKQIK